MIPLLVVCVLMLVAAAVAMTLRNLIHSVLLLTLNWIAIAVFYLWAGAEFVAFAQMLVYVGAVSMVVLFAVLLTRHTREDDTGVVSKRESWSRATAGVVTAAVVAGVLCGAVVSTPFAGGPAAPPSISVRRIGELLMGPHAAALLIIGVLLTVALIGAIVIAAQDHDRGRDPDP